jgi:hypothetical protein
MTEMYFGEEEQFVTIFLLSRHEGRARRAKRSLAPEDDVDWKGYIGTPTKTPLPLAETNVIGVPLVTLAAAAMLVVVDAAGSISTFTAILRISPQRALKAAAEPLCLCSWIRQHRI